MIAGDQVPVIPSKEVVGSGAEVPPAQIGGAGLKVGTGKTEKKIWHWVRSLKLTNF